MRNDGKIDGNVQSAERFDGGTGGPRGRHLGTCARRSGARDFCENSQGRSGKIETGHGTLRCSLPLPSIPYRSLPFPFVPFRSLPLPTMYSFRLRSLRSSVLAPASSSRYSLRERQPVNYAEASLEHHHHEGCCGDAAAVTPSTAAADALRLVEEVLAYARDYEARCNTIRLTPEERREARGPSVAGPRRSTRLAGQTREDAEMPTPRRSPRLARLAETTAAPAATTKAAPRSMYTLRPRK